MVRKSIGAIARRPLIMTAAICFAFATPAAAAVPGVSKFDGADTAWLLLCATLVLMMTIPGLALFYGGMVRRKNVLSTLMQSFVLVAIVSIQWVLFGYS
ncbi:MAG: ammonia channel protein, partial [Candidatus Binatus sp.]